MSTKQLVGTRIRARRSGLEIVMGALALCVLPHATNALVQTSKADEKRVSRIVRLTPESETFRPYLFCLLQAFNQTSDKVLLWGSKGPAWARVDAITSWQTSAEFAAAVHVIPRWGSRYHQPIWSEVPGEADVIYSMNLDSGEVMKADLRSNTSSVVVQLPGSPVFAQNFFLPGFSADYKLIVWEAPDDPNSRGWEVDPVARTARALSGQPPQWTTDWSRLPYNSHGHSARSPDRKMIIGSQAPDGKGYTSYLQQSGQRSVGLAYEPQLNHVSWHSSDQWAVFDDVSGGTIYQLWPDGTLAKLLDLRLSQIGLDKPDGYPRSSSFPNPSRDGRMMIYSSDGGDPSQSIGIFLAFLEDAGSGKPVVVDTFAAQPVRILAGAQSSVLTWTTRNATALRMTPTPGLVGASGSLTVAPPTGVEYELIAEGASGSARARATVEVVEKVPTSLLPNGSMEVGTLGGLPQGWSASAGTVLTRDSVHDFSNAVRVTSNASMGSQGKVWAWASPENTRLAQGHRVKLSAWLKSATGRPVRPDSLQIAHGVSPITTIESAVTRTVGSEWKRFEMAAVLPPDIAGGLQGTIVGVGGWESASVYVDQVALEVDDPPAPPVIEDFAIDAGSQARGVPLALEWRTRNATSVVLMPGGVPLEPPDGGVAVLGGDYPAPVVGSLVQVVAQGPGGSVSKTLTVLSTGSSGPLGPPGAPQLSR